MSFVETCVNFASLITFWENRVGIKFKGCVASVNGEIVKLAWYCQYLSGRSDRTMYHVVDSNLRETAKLEDKTARFYLDFPIATQSIRGRALPKLGRNTLRLMRYTLIAGEFPQVRPGKKGLVVVNFKEIFNYKSGIWRSGRGEI